MLTRNHVFFERGATSSQSGLLRTQSCLISAHPLSFNDIDPTKWVALMPNGLKRRPPLRNGTLWKIGRILWKHLVDFFENQPNEICGHLSVKASKGRFPTPEKLQNHSNESKELKRKGEKERARRKSEGEKKAMIALFVCIIATLLDTKGHLAIARITLSKIQVDILWIN